MTPEQKSVVSRRGGKRTNELYPEMARKNAKKAQQLHPNLTSRAGQIGGKRCHELHPDLAKEFGRRAVESGHIYKIGTFKSCSTGGKIGGKKNVDSGHWANIRSLGLHTRWHVRRNIINPACGLCQAPELARSAVA